MSYTVEQVEVLKTGIANKTAPADLATTLGKSTASVIAKLAQLGLYEAKQRTSATPRVTKIQMIQVLAEKIGVDWNTLKSLEKADKSALETLVKTL